MKWPDHFMKKESHGWILIRYRGLNAPSVQQDPSGIQIYKVRRPQDYQRRSNNDQTRIRMGLESMGVITAKAPPVTLLLYRNASRVYDYANCTSTLICSPFLKVSSGYTNTHKYQTNYGTATTKQSNIRYATLT